MALERKDNIGDTSTTTGTGTLNLAATAQTGARIFAGNVTSGATVRYHIENADQTEWEIGEGVFTDGAPDTLTRVTVYASSNAGSLVDFSAGTKNVSLVHTVQDMTPATGAEINTGTDDAKFATPKAIADSFVNNLKYAADAEASDAYAITVAPAPSAYAIGQTYLFKANTANTGAATLNVNSLGAKTIKKKGNTDLANNDILANNMVLVAFNEVQVAGATIDSYSESNKDAQKNIYTGSSDGRAIAQTFTVPTFSAILTRATFNISQFNEDANVTIFAKLYATSGGAPTGSALATSAGKALNVLGGAFSNVNFDFSDNYEMQAGVTYAIAIEHNAGSASLYMEVGVDNSSPSHAGTQYKYDGTNWTSVSGSDICFYVIGTQAQTRFEMLSQIAN